MRVHTAEEDRLQIGNVTHASQWWATQVTSRNEMIPEQCVMRFDA